jgi:lipopolysaccharide/colanic/teichoic acid biosynthesis glycosyltransferase
MNLSYKESPMTVNESILMESRSGQPALAGDGPASHLFFHELVKRRSLAIRVSDRLLALIALTLTAPLFPLVALAIKLTHGGPVFTVQKGVGYRGFTFHAYTFHTKVKGELTGFGRMLRATRIEYLPLFAHVLTGKMSLVGITLRTNDTANLLNNRIDWFYKCYAAKPGIVTWASVNGYGFATGEFNDQRRQAELDLLYVLNQSTSMYFRILLRTLFAVPVSIPTSLNLPAQSTDSRHLQLHG